MIAGVGIEKVLRRKSGRRLSEPVPSFYTQKVFKEVTGTGMLPLVKQFAEDEWVWGAGGVSGASWPKLTAQVTELYERDYTSAWDALLNDLEIVPFSTVQQYADALGILVGPTTSPLRGILKTVVDNTSLVAPPPRSTAALSLVGTEITEGAKDLFNDGSEEVTGTSSVPPGTVITQHFQPIHRSWPEHRAPIDAVLEQIRKIREQLLKLGPQVGGANPLKALADPAVARPPARAAARRGKPAAAGQHPGRPDCSERRRAVSARTRPESSRSCIRKRSWRSAARGSRAAIRSATAADMPLSDFGEVFGTAVCTTSSSPTTSRSWSTRRSVRGPGVPSPWRRQPACWLQFERAERIRQMFFSPGSKTPELDFDLRLSNLDAAGDAVLRRHRRPAVST